MHSKVLLIEKTVLMMGSANFTHNSLENCIEHCLITRDIESIKRVETRFSRLWAQGAALEDGLIKADSARGALRNAAAFKALEDRKYDDVSRRSTELRSVALVAHPDEPQLVPERDRRAGRRTATEKSASKRSGSGSQRSSKAWEGFRSI